ncbi:hypothetical protein R1flu_012180 [Riccia fluitans]|uniref:Uncharacterized protein n=1 Tax=Riccia fluitans TaxID=41844 RepID=A0ABD1Z9V7_9MARC
MATLHAVCCSPAVEVVGFCSESVSTSSRGSSLGSGLVCRRLAQGFHIGKIHGTRAGRRRTRGGVAIRARGGGEKPGDNESKQVLDAFFLGKALAETINERLGAAVGEFLSDVGRQQAEQQKKIREFQDEVQERAKAAAAKAARKALSAENSRSPTMNQYLDRWPFVCVFYVFLQVMENTRCWKLGAATA